MHMRHLIRMEKMLYMPSCKNRFNKTTNLNLDLNFVFHYYLVERKLMMSSFSLLNVVLAVFANVSASVNGVIFQIVFGEARPNFKSKRLGEQR